MFFLTSSNSSLYRFSPPSQKPRGGGPRRLSSTRAGNKGCHDDAPRQSSSQLNDVCFSRDSRRGPHGIVWSTEFVGGVFSFGLGGSGAPENGGGAVWMNRFTRMGSLAVAVEPSSKVHQRFNTFVVVRLPSWTVWKACLGLIITLQYELQAR